MIYDAEWPDDSLSHLAPARKQITVAIFFDIQKAYDWLRAKNFSHKSINQSKHISMLQNSLYVDDFAIYYSSSSLRHIQRIMNKAIKNIQNYFIVLSVEKTQDVL